MSKKKVFIVHGRDYSMRKSVEKHIRDLGLDPIVLHKQVNRGSGVIEKLERCAKEASYAIILFSEEDLGRYKEDKELRSRARQNVIFEYGLLMGLLGRGNTALIKKGDVEIPSDLNGIVYIDYGRRYKWREAIAKEFEIAGILPPHNDN